MVEGPLSAEVIAQHYISSKLNPRVRQVSCPTCATRQPKLTGAVGFRLCALSKWSTKFQLLAIGIQVRFEQLVVASKL